MLVVLLLALGIPLTVTLQRRAASELQDQALIQAQGVAAQISGHNIRDPGELDQLVTQAAAQLGARVIVVDPEGTLIADSEGDANLGEDYAKEFAVMNKLSADFVAGAFTVRRQKPPN